jgi:hypothetical protein
MFCRVFFVANVANNRHTFLAKRKFVLVCQSDDTPIANLANESDSSTGIHSECATFSWVLFNTTARVKTFIAILLIGINYECIDYIPDFGTDW